MSVYQVEEYYVFIQFKEALTDDQRQEITEWLIEEGHDDYVLNDSDLTIEPFESDSDGEEVEELFTEEFSNLIK